MNLPGRHRPAGGLTLIELVVVIALVAILLVAAVPGLRSTITNSRSRSVVAQFSQDFAWARAEAANTNHTEMLTLKKDCSWSIVQDQGTANQTTLTNRGMSAADVAKAGISCSASNGLALDQSFYFATQYVLTGLPALNCVSGICNSTTGAASGKLTFTSSTGQKWTLQVFTSGTLISDTAS